MTSNVRDLVVAAAVVVFGALHPAHAAGQMFPNLSIAIGSNPIGVAATDFNGDGRTDIAVVNPPTDDVSVRFAKADGTFAAEIRIAVGNEPKAIVAGDFNGDGLGDLAVASSRDNAVAILIGRGGSFAPVSSMPVQGQPSSLLVADVNNDGHPDLVVGTGGILPALNDSVALLLGRGDGTFEPERRIATQGAVNGLASGDFNGDGRADLAVSLSPFVVVMFIGDGAGGFTQTAAPSLLLPLGALAIGDLTGDGRPDLIAAAKFVPIVAVFPGNGDGTFGSEILTSHGAGDVGAIEVGDFDRDGRLDAVVTASQVVAVLTGAGDGTFRAERDLSAGTAPTAMTRVDLNGDAFVDLVVVSKVSSDVHLLAGTSTGTFDRGLRVPSLSGPAGVAVSDFDGDGRADLAVIHRDSGDVTVQLGTGGGGFDAPARYVVGGAPRAVAAADLNEDGAPDLIVVGATSDHFQPLLNTGHGTFSLGPLEVFASNPNAVGVGDVNGDGHVDILTTSETSGDVTINVGVGNGFFVGTQTVHASPVAEAIAVGDLNHDGFADAVVGGSGLTLLLGKAQTPFLVAAGTFDAANVTGDVRLVDVDADGALDIVSTNRQLRGTPDGNSGDSVSEVRVYFGRGDGTFLPAVVRNAPFAVPDAVAVADLSGDGRLDLVVFGHTFTGPPSTNADPHGSGVAVFLASGDRTFNAADLYRTGIGVPLFFPGAVDLAHGGAVVGDVTGDGRPDLVVANYADDDVSILVNAGMDAARATTRILTLGTGRGQVVSVPAGIACDPDCTIETAASAEIHLMPTAVAGSVFAGFTGDPGCAATFTANADRTCVAVFNLVTAPAVQTRLAVYKRGLWVVDRAAPGLENCRNDSCASFGSAEVDALGAPRLRPVVGDWTGSGHSSIGVFDPGAGTWLLDRDGDGVADNCAEDFCYQFIGPFTGSTVVPIVGDWTGDGRDKIGTTVTNPCFRFCAPTGTTLDLNGNGVFDGCGVDACITPSVGQVAGDWLGTGVDRVGEYRFGQWWLDTNGNFSRDPCGIDLCADFGLDGATPVVGDWDGSGRDKIGLYLDGLWVLDWNGNFQFDGCEVDRCAVVGDANSIPVAGKF